MTRLTLSSWTTILARRAALLIAVALWTGSGRAQSPPIVREAVESRAPGDGTLAPAFRLNVNVDLVEIQVLARDSDGRHVTTLEQDDFVVAEDQVTQTITLFRQNDRPVSLGLVIDNSRSMERKKDRVDAAALSFVEYSNPEDEAFLIHFDDTARLAEGFTQDTTPIRDTLRTIQPYGQTALFDAVDLALRTIGLGQHDQKAILLISDGTDNASVQSFDGVLENVRQSDATLYAIGVFRSPSMGAEARMLLEALAEAGGGRAFFPDSADEVPSLTLQIAQEIRDQYTLGYAPSNFAHDGTWRSVRVEVQPDAGRGRLELNYRHGYYAPIDPTD